MDHTSKPNDTIPAPPPIEPLILTMHLEIETEGMTLLQFAATVDAILHLAGLKGRVRCSLGAVQS